MWFIWWDACGLLCFLFGEAVVWFANYVTVFEILTPWLGTQNPWFWVNLVCFEFIIGLVASSHFRAACTDPGSVPLDTATVEDFFAPVSDPDALIKPKRRYCRKCRSIKPARAHHCSTCGRCIVKMDHHCPWVNNCVGQNNHKYFIQFIVFVFVGCLYATILAISNVGYCYHTKTCAKPPTLRVILAVVAVVLAIFFAIFVTAMACDQYEAIVTDTTGIEAMKRWPERDLSLADGMMKPCGPFSWRWLFPIPPAGDALFRFNPENKDDVDVRDPLLRQHIDRIRNFSDEQLRVYREKQILDVQAEFKLDDAFLATLGVRPDAAARVEAMFPREEPATREGRRRKTVEGGHGHSHGGHGHSHSATGECVYDEADGNGDGDGGGATDGRGEFGTKTRVINQQQYRTHGEGSGRPGVPIITRGDTEYAYVPPGMEDQFPEDEWTTDEEDEGDDDGEPYDGLTPDVQPAPHPVAHHHEDEDAPALGCARPDATATGGGKSAAPGGAKSAPEGARTANGGGAAAAKSPSAVASASASVATSPAAAGSAAGARKRKGK